MQKILLYSILFNSLLFIFVPYQIQPEEQPSSTKMNTPRLISKFIENNYAPIYYAVPPNNNCAEAISVSNGTYYGDTSTATPDGVSACDNSSPPLDVWYKYSATATGLIVINTFDSYYDTMLSVYANCPGNEENELVCNDDCGSMHSCLSFYAQAGKDYLIRVSGFNGNSGLYTLTISKPGSISGTVTTSIPLQPVPIANVDIYLYNSDGMWIASALTNTQGNYTLAELNPGNYLVVTANDNNYIDELYNDITCEPWCNPLAGIPIVVLEDQDTPNINFELTPGGLITGYVKESATALPIPDALVDIYDSNGNWKTYGIADSSGFYFSRHPLVTGNYYALTRTAGNYLDEVYNNIPCEPSCDPTTGTPISLVAGQNKPNINFNLNQGVSLAQ